MYYIKPETENTISTLEKDKNSGWAFSYELGYRYLIEFSEESEITPLLSKSINNATYILRTHYPNEAGWIITRIDKHGNKMC